MINVCFSAHGRKFMSLPILFFFCAFEWWLAMISKTFRTLTMMDQYYTTVRMTLRIKVADKYPVIKLQ